MSDKKTKICSRCEQEKPHNEFYKDKRTKDGRAYQCKECQKERASKNYKEKRTKKKRKEYYEQTKAKQRKQARKYYKENKEDVLEKQREYRNSKKGKKVMKKAHKKRRELIKENQGEPYTRGQVIKRDAVFMYDPIKDKERDIPICGICGEPIFRRGEIHIDHIVPIAEGGLDGLNNVRCTHEKCNLTRHRVFDTEDREIR